MNYLKNIHSKYNINTLWPYSGKVKTILMCSYPYRTKEIDSILKKAPYKIARYAWSKDYHKFIKKKLTATLSNILPSNILYRICIDTTPLPERYYGRLANLGFIGKNGLLIDPKHGSYFFIATVLLDYKLPSFYRDINIDIKKTKSINFDIKNFCGTCNLCIISCPTKAILDNAIIDSNKCISYWTIESKKQEPAVGIKFGKWIFGCDICQMVCPYNKDTGFTSNNMFPIHSSIIEIANGNIDTMNDNDLNGSVLKRAGLNKIRNYINIKKGD